jgi:hypothetical protein
VGFVRVFHQTRAAWHEAGHAAVLILAGRFPLVIRADWPNADFAGYVTQDLGEDGLTPELARDSARSILAGPLMEGMDGWPPPWPLPETGDGDLRALRSVTTWLKFDEADWHELLAEVRAQMKDRQFRRIVIRLRDALMDDAVLTPDDQRALLADLLNGAT